ncbi:MAG TPA: hypothetical protein VFZ83_00715 [Acidimicrobiia bacterium]|nr:hypothetical protein [Acidimicrobiia bacterium]
MTTVTLLVGGRETAIDARRDDDRLLVDPDGFARATGWTLRPEGLCRDEVCIPVRDVDAVAPGGRLDLHRVVAALRLPAAIDTDELVAALAEHASAAPPPPTTDAADFTLPTLSGEPFTFSAIGRKKKVLTTWASW